MPQAKPAATIIIHVSDAKGNPLPIDTNLLTDTKYRRALTLGVSIMLMTNELNYTDVKPEESKP